MYLIEYRCGLTRLSAKITLVRPGDIMNALSALRSSTATFSRGTAYKIGFVALIYLDLLLTVFALRHGASEMNPVMLRLLDNPLELGLVKVVIPVFIAWLVPSMLLLLSIAFMAGVTGWNLTQLLSLY